MFSKFIFVLLITFLDCIWIYFYNKHLHNHQSEVIKLVSSLWTVFFVLVLSLFGWLYVVYENGADQFIKRVCLVIWLVPILITTLLCTSGRKNG